ncbi:MAG TPA: hypothetical protein VMB52_04635 [Verrucomicrobiae bacterium]|nr:hypothetical protein [Verrucomicrobiae bacterium]
MSRILAELLGAAEPRFRQQIAQLERAAGLPGADIRLAMEVVNETRHRLRELGLDPHDTTGPELYKALQNRLLHDETQVRASLNIRADGTPQAVLEAVEKYLSGITLPAETLAVKQSVMRVMLKKLKPMATCKRLGYRSLDSMIKHEPAALLLVAASMVESHDWQKRRLEAYKRLRVSDFETHKVSFLLPKSKRWPDVAAEYAIRIQHTVLAVPELGAVVILPPEHDLPSLAISTLLLAVDSVNDMRSFGSYLKLQQVRPDFGEAFVKALTYEPLAAAEFAGEQLPWKVVQWFYGHGHSQYYPDVFEPHVQPEDLMWHDAEALLAQIHPSLAFWQGNQLLGLLDAANNAVSLNVVDVALSVCNTLDYGQRLVNNMRLSLGRELMARYLHHENLHNLLLGQLDEQLTP